VIAPDFGTTYVSHAPSPQATIDLFAGDWSSAFPESLGVVAGTSTLFDDARITWVIDQLGDIDGWRVLELGPLEGGHTSMLHSAGASVTAVEANPRAFLRCLITKELLHLDSCRFLLGDFVAYLDESPDQRFDLVLASGVVYHSTDPVALLTKLAGRADRIAIWTHYFDASVLEAMPDQIRHFDPDVEEQQLDGRTLRLHRRDYFESVEWSGFCGGPAPYALWLEKDDLLAVLRHLGYESIEVGMDSPEHPHGPHILLLASRR
jgi:SAM-dependent methyltransferase